MYNQRLQLPSKVHVYVQSVIDLALEITRVRTAIMLYIPLQINVQYAQD